MEWSLGLSSDITSHGAGWERTPPFRQLSSRLTVVMCPGLDRDGCSTTSCRGAIPTGLVCRYGLQNATMMHMARCTRNKCELDTQVHQLLALLDKNKKSSARSSQSQHSHSAPTCTQHYGPGQGDVLLAEWN